MSTQTAEESPIISFETHPDRYKHWKLEVDGSVARLTMSVQEDGGLKPGYQLKLNSYDLGVDIELQDAIQRLRFEHPEVRSGRRVIVTRIFEIEKLKRDLPNNWREYIRNINERDGPL